MSAYNYKEFNHSLLSNNKKGTNFVRYATNEKLDPHLINRTSTDKVVSNNCIVHTTKTLNFIECIVQSVQGEFLQNSEIDTILIQCLHW